VLLDVLRKVLGQRLPAPLIVISANLGSASLCTVLLWLHGESLWDWTFAAVVVCQAAFNAVAAILVVHVLTFSPLTLTVPYLGFTPIVITGVAALILQEAPHLQGCIGIGLVVIGAIALHSGGNISFRALLTAPLLCHDGYLLIIRVVFSLSSAVAALLRIRSTQQRFSFAVAQLLLHGMTVPPLT